MRHRSGLIAIVAVSAIFFYMGAFIDVSTAYGSTVAASPVSRSKPSGLTLWGIQNSRRSGTPGPMVKLASEGDEALLSKARDLGPRAPMATMRLTIGLKLRNLRKLKQLLSQVQDPNSPNYHHFLTPSQFDRQYGPTSVQVDAVKRYLKRNGIKVESISANHTLIHARGTTASFEHAFSVRIHNYQLNGRKFLSTKDRPTVPRGLAGIVLNVLGLDRAEVMHPYSHYEKTQPSGAHSNGASHKMSPPPATASNSYFVPSQIATAYDWPSITNVNNGAGVSVAIITADSSGLSSSDAPATFWNAYGLPNHQINVIHVDGDEGLTDGMVETLLDIEWSGAMAPGISQDVYVASNPSFIAFDDAYNKCVNDDTAQVMTTSWGGPEFEYGSLAQISDQIFMQGAAEGISMFAAAGDSGTTGYSDPNSNVDNNADFPSSSPYITAANGSELKISDASGTYATEYAWSATGGAISQMFTQPSWQTGTGVPNNGMRMNSDMSLNSGGQYGSQYVVYDPQASFSGYIYLYGTSAVAPQLAALFAIGVSKNGGTSLGQSNKLIYGEANAGSYLTDFHDITVGCNGVLPDGSPSCAKAGWDHPTGWGSPKASAFLSDLGVVGPSGTLSGTVADASGDPVAGAAISVDGSYQGLSGSDGSYLITLPAGSHQVTVGAFGYQKDTKSASISANATTTRDFTLDAAPVATVTGKVTDGSGHGYGLYADITVKVANTPSGYGKPTNLQVADVWTDPKNGTYSVELPQGYGYNLHVAAAFDGYQTGTKSVTPSGDTSQNFPLKVTGTCSAPGYHFALGGFGEDFNAPTFPPPGWTVTNPANHPVVWELSSAPGNYPNQTGGTGTAAEPNVFLGFNPFNNPPYAAFDTSLVTPPISATALSGSVLLRYKADYGGNPAMPLDLDITTDGGSTWTSILHWTTGQPSTGARGEDVHVNLSPYLPSSGNFQLRWHFHGPASYATTTAQIDDVVIGVCQPDSGGLIMGQVTDANTGKPIVDARIVDGNGVGASTVENYSDPNLPVGFYEFFDKSGQHTLTAHAFRNYAAKAVNVALNDNGVVVKNFSLNAASFEVNPGQFTLHVMANSSVTASFALSNTGGAAALYKVLAIGAPAPVSQKDATNAPSAGTASGWQVIASYPQAGIGDNTAARDPVTGRIYSMGGFITESTGFEGPVTNLAYVYDPSTNSWSSLPDAPVARQAAASAFIDGKFYVVNGWDSDGGSPVAETDIYDPISGQWNIGHPNPVPEGGSSYAVLNGSLYVVGGCQKRSFPYCGTEPTDSVEVYHPVSDSWSSAAHYPHATAFASCGAIAGKLYCAGGTQDNGVQGDGYVYDPATNSWSPIPPMFVPLGGAFYTAADGLLMVAGGINVDASLSTQAEAYDPQEGSWFPLPKLRTTVMRGGHTCGFYEIGGITGLSPNLGILSTNDSAVLPGYTQQCGTVPSAPWVTVTPASGTLQAGASKMVTVSVNGNGQKAYTTSKAYLSITNKSPYGPVIVPLAVTWMPQPAALVTQVTANPNPVSPDSSFTLSITVRNRAVNGDGGATQVVLAFAMPTGMSYVSGPGCTESNGMVSCDMGDIGQGDEKSLAVVLKSGKKGAYETTFTATSREPQDSQYEGKNTLNFAGAVGTLKSSSGGNGKSGGGALGWLTLLALLGLSEVIRRRRLRD